jgi:hypothetical protein
LNTDLTEQKDDLESNVAQATAQLNVCNTELGSANSEITSLEARIVQINTENASDINQLNAEQRAAIQTLQTQLDNINTQINTKMASGLVNR